MQFRITQYAAKVTLDQNADLDWPLDTEKPSRERVFPVRTSFTASCKKWPMALPSGVRDFRMMRRSVVDAILTPIVRTLAWVRFLNYLDYQR